MLMRSRWMSALRWGAANEPGRSRLEKPREPRPFYAIGDVHGALDALRSLEALIKRDAGGSPEPPLVVLLGDLIDRGPFSAQVLDHAMSPAPFERVTLAGNHEIMLLDYLAGRIPFARWEEHGGMATCLSFGIDPSYRGLRRDPAQLRATLRDAMGPDRLAFLTDLPVLLRIEPFVLVHAGVRPSVPLADQTDADLTTIRGEFLAGSADLSFDVIHGHTPVPEPSVTDRRIAVDTEAWRTGRLTAAKVSGTKVSFLTAVADRT